jgi:hypothetical protein
MTGALNRLDTHAKRVLVGQANRFRVARTLARTEHCATTPPLGATTTASVC